MSNIFLSSMIAFIVTVVAIAFLAIGWLITGKSKIEKSCGKDPTLKAGKDCEKNSCHVCEHNEESIKDE